MRRAKITAAVVVVLILIILAYQNPDPVVFKFLGWEVHIAKIMLMVASALTGSIATLIIQFLLRSGRAPTPAPEKPAAIPSSAGAPSA